MRRRSSDPLLGESRGGQEGRAVRLGASHRPTGTAYLSAAVEQSHPAAHRVFSYPENSAGKAGQTARHPSARGSGFESSRSAGLDDESAATEIAGTHKTTVQRIFSVISLLPARVLEPCPLPLLPRLLLRCASSPGWDRELRRIADACVTVEQHTSSVFPAPAHTQRVWSEEVARVLARAPTLQPAARRALRATLRALADDPSIDDTTRLDVIAMLTATAPIVSGGRAQRRRRSRLGRVRRHSRAHPA